MSDIQETRRKHLIPLVDAFHRSRYGDYDSTYEEFWNTYIEAEQNTDEGGDFDPAPLLPIPQYASLHSDETYGMIEVFDSLNDALRDQLPTGEDTLSVPNGVIDLDTGKNVEMKMVAMTTEAYERMQIVLRSQIETLGLDVHNNSVLAELAAVFNV